MMRYVTVGTNDMPRAAKFYDTLLGAIGAKRMMEGDRFIAWSVSPDLPGFGIAKPFDGKPATIGNGCMTAFATLEPKQVDALYKKAMELGATDEGLPGLRGGSFYAAYFRDLD